MFFQLHQVLFLGSEDLLDVPEVQFFVLEFDGVRGWVGRDCLLREEFAVAEGDVGGVRGGRGGEGVESLLHMNNYSIKRQISHSNLTNF